MGESRRKEWAKTSAFHARVVNLASVLVMIAASGYIHVAHPEKMPGASQRDHTNFLNGLRSTGPSLSARRDRNKKRIAVGRAKWRENWQSGMEKELDEVCDDIDKAWADWKDESVSTSVRSLNESSSSSNSLLGRRRDAIRGGHGGGSVEKRDGTSAMQGTDHSHNSRRQAREKKEFLETVRDSNQRTPKTFRHRAPSSTATPPQDGDTRVDDASPLVRKRVLRTRKVQSMPATDTDTKTRSPRGIML